MGVRIRSRLAGEASPSTSELDRRAVMSIRDYIETHLHDPDMTPQRIADALHMSARYLHHLFSDGDETAARYILRRRLDECARSMLDASRRDRSLLDIAMSFGFNNASHFGRVFRQRFRMSPSEYRRHSGARSPLREADA